MNLLRTLSKKEKIFLGIFCVLMFLFSNAIEIDGNTCQTSPCSRYNDSHYLSPTENRIDYVINSNTQLFLAPTALLVRPLLESHYTLKEWVSKPTITPEFWFDGAGAYSFIDLDRKNEDRNDTDKVWGEKDAGALFLALIIIKAVVLLSLPLWIILGVLLLKLHQKSIMWGNITISLIVSLLLIMKLGELVAQNVTWINRADWELFKILIS